MSFTPLQTAVLDEVTRRRLTVVRAGPGTGKTRVFVEVLRRQLTEWTAVHAGVAALSFTNVAHEVVADRLGGSPPAPHFVGTLDAFLLRFVIAPFWKLLGFCAGGPRLVPEPLASALEFPVLPYGPQPYETAPLFQWAFGSGTEAAPVAKLRNKFGIPFEASLEASRRCLILKEREWKQRGRITHADCHYLASRLLTGAHGPVILSIVARRFPVVLVDEFQDTGWFLGRAVLSLLKVVSKGLVVGDPDQAIFQFSGSDRSLFEKVDNLAGEPSLLLNESHRCSRRICTVATALSRSGKAVVPREHAIDGRTFLVVHKHQTPDPAAVLKAIADVDVAKAATVVLTRRRSRVASTTTNPWKGVPSRICEAIAFLHAGSSRSAANLLLRTLSKLLLDDETPTESDLLRVGIELRRWRRDVAEVLVQVAAPVAGETWNGWMVRTRAAVTSLATRYSLDVKPIGTTLKKSNNGGNELRPSITPAPVAREQFPRLTIHSAKGREYDVVVLALEKPHATHAPCPSDSWWDATTEEREVAYVACSRAKSTLVIAVHRTTYTALAATRASFLGLFDVVFLEDPA
jgi:DNA helicase-2/ATP-dependent DNA helicase PcrA